MRGAFAPGTPWIHNGSGLGQPVFALHDYGAEETASEFGDCEEHPVSLREESWRCWASKLGADWLLADAVELVLSQHDSPATGDW